MSEQFKLLAMLVSYVVIYNNFQISELVSFLAVSSAHFHSMIDIETQDEQHMLCHILSGMLRISGFQLSVYKGAYLILLVVSHL